MNPGRVVLVVVFLCLASAAGWLLLTDVQREDGMGRGGGTVSVVTAPVNSRPFSDIVEALGTAKARESVTLTSRVSDTVQSIHFEDGQLVKRGDVLVRLEDEEEKAQLREAEANLKEAEQQFVRIKNLVKQGNASTATLDAQQRSVNEARYRLEAATARLADMKIVAPFDGVLGLRQVSEGSLITPNTAITTIDAIDLIKLDFTVPERFIATLGAGQHVRAKVDAYQGRLFEGLIKTVDSRVDPATRAVIVRAEVPNPDRALRPGMLMTVEVISRTWDGLSVAEEAVVPSGGHNYVFVVEGGQSARREVKLGLRRPGYVEVTEGLSAGERVVIEGTLRLGAQPMPVRDMAPDLKAAAPSGGVL